MRCFFPIFGVALIVAACLGGCSKPKDYRVAGAHWLEAEEASENPVFDVLAYPIDEDELAYFEEALGRIEQAAGRYPEVWREISSVENPVLAADNNDVWKTAEVLGEDVIAVTTKLTFLLEFASSDEPVEAEMRENLVWIEKRLETDEADQELWDAANYIRSMLEVIDAHNQAGAFALYRGNKARFDAALDRFTSIGEE